MCHLQFLTIFKIRYDGNNRVHILKNLFPTFRLEYLVELDLQQNRLEMLREGNKPLTNFKKKSLSSSWYLKERPDLSNATNLKGLDLSCLQEFSKASLLYF